MFLVGFDRISDVANSRLKLDSYIPVGLVSYSLSQNNGFLRVNLILNVMIFEKKK